MKKQLEKAMTLIELLTVVTVIAIMSAVVFGNYNKGGEGLALERAAQKLSQDLRKVQEMTMSGLPDGTAYGIYFDKTTNNNTFYKVFKKTNTNYYYEAGSAIETINIESSVRIYDLKYDAINQNQASVAFRPPEPRTYIGTDYFTYGELSIVLCSVNDTSKTRTVKINNGGRVDITNP